MLHSSLTLDYPRRLNPLVASQNLCVPFLLCAPSFAELTSRHSEYKMSKFVLFQLFIEDCLLTSFDPFTAVRPFARGPLPARLNLTSFVLQ